IRRTTSLLPQRPARVERAASPAAPVRLPAPDDTEGGGACHTGAAVRRYGGDRGGGARGTPQGTRVVRRQAARTTPPRPHRLVRTPPPDPRMGPWRRGQRLPPRPPPRLQPPARP